VRLLRALAVLLVGCGLLAAPAGAQAPIRFAVAFSDHARLGGSTAVQVRLGINPRLAPVTEIRLLTPPGLTLAESRLGTAPCGRPAIEVTKVMNAVAHGRCPPNSLMGRGSATAGLLLSELETISGAAFIELHAGPSIGDKPGLLITADTYHPARMQLTYAAPPPFGLGMALLIPPIPILPFDAQIALTDFHLVVGSSSIIYNKIVNGKRVAYHPGGIPLPDSCPRGGFRFRAIARFADGTRQSVDTTVPCPPVRKAAAAARVL
jgi:hypothetical protein